MKTITKKEFKQLHSGNKLELVCCADFDHLHCIDVLRRTVQPIVTRPTSKHSVDSQGENYVVTVYTETIQDRQFIFSAAKIDNSKDNYTSRTNTQYETVIYIVKEV